MPAIASIGAFSFLTDTRYKSDGDFQLQTLQSIYTQAGNWSEHEGLIRRGTLNALAGSGELQQVAAAYQSPVEYPKNNGLANQLKLVAQVVAANLETRLFSVSMGGFDTHADQKDLANVKRRDDVDVRSVYTLRDVLGADPAPILGGTFEPLSVLSG